MKIVKVVAPAKVNLFLSVGEKQEDGYHQVVSVMHALGMHDTLTLIAYPEGTPQDLIPVKEQNRQEVSEGPLTVTGEVEWHEGLPEAELDLKDNIVAKAIFALARACGFPWKGRLHFLLEKHIPLQAGLGGGSADAAAALVGVAEVFGIQDTDLLNRVACELGADVPFFLMGGAVLLEGRGDTFARTLTARHDNVVIVHVPGGVSTPEAYREFDRDSQATPPADLAAAEAARDAAEVPLYNNLAAASERLLPELTEVREWIAQQPGVQQVLLCGSGSATFAVCDNHRSALALVTAASAKGYWTRATTFSRLRAAIVPEDR
ncbi:MAG: 4-(cytidine 5'-diphospho)-2-C-methyl-D-erythritol kinase [Eggerthellaceae bacterium]|jgi:4-diphosphocytidyl-2-C-methyl-D-erythritol kinase